MASESTEEESVTIHLPPELREWLDSHATSQDVDRETLLMQLVASYRHTTDGEFEGPAVLLDEGEIAGLEEQISEARNAVQRQLGNRIDETETTFQKKLEDVRERVIEVKKEADGKAPKDHTHPQIDQLDDIGERLDALETDIDDLRHAVDSTVPENEERIEELEATLDTVQERLQTIAWVVSDLREAQEASEKLDPVDRIKRAAAKADIQRAKCENCGEGVTIALLTDPQCPHCEATVSNVEPASGFFGKPTLLVASQLESGEDV